MAQVPADGVAAQLNEELRMKNEDFVSRTIGLTP